MVHLLEREQLVPVAPEVAFGLYGDAANLEPLTPPWLHFRVLATDRTHMGEGTVIDYRLRVRGVPIRWTARIVEWKPATRFTDVQLRGPYRLWHHTHTFEPRGDGTVIRDVVRYALPFGPVGAIAHALLVRRDLERIFDYRRDETARLLG